MFSESPRSAESGTLKILARRSIVFEFQGSLLKTGRKFVFQGPFQTSRGLEMRYSSRRIRIEPWIWIFMRKNINSKDLSIFKDIFTWNLQFQHGKPLRIPKQPWNRWGHHCLALNLQFCWANHDFQPWFLADFIVWQSFGSQKSNFPCWNWLKTEVLIAGLRKPFVGRRSCNWLSIFTRFLTFH